MNVKSWSALRRLLGAALVTLAPPATADGAFVCRDSSAGTSGFTALRGTPATAHG